MQSPKTIMENIRREKVERLLSSPPSGFLISRGFRRFFCVVAVLFSYLFFFSLLIPTLSIASGISGPHKVVTINDLDATQRFWLGIAAFVGWTAYLAPVILLAAFILLRASMRRVTSLPDEYLDEREIANRDWAFKTGYVVIRRVGFSIAAILLAIKVISFNPSIVLDSDGNRVRTGIEATAHNFENYLVSLTTQGAINFYFNFFAILTYVAFSFPLILLAWRESKLDEVPPVAESRVPLEGASQLAKQYFRRAALVGGIFAGFTLLLTVGFSFRPLGEFLTFSGVLFIFVFLAVPYALFVYIWASVKTVGVLKAAKQNNYNQGKYAASAIGALVFFVITQLLGLAIPVIFSQLGRFSGNDNPVALVFVLGLAMIPTQVMSFVFIRRLGKAENTAELISTN